MISINVPWQLWAYLVPFSRLTAISVENHNFPTPVHFATPLKRFPWNWYRRLGSETRMMGAIGQKRSLTMSSAVLIQYTNMSDGRTDTGRQQKPHLRIASRSKNTPQNVQFEVFELQLTFYPRNVHLVSAVCYGDVAVWLAGWVGGCLYVTAGIV